VEDAAMPVGPIHHGCNREAIVLIFQQITPHNQRTRRRTCTRCVHSKL